MRIFGVVLSIAMWMVFAYAQEMTSTVAITTTMDMNTTTEALSTITVMHGGADMSIKQESELN